jgi:hypothetical protein
MPANGASPRIGQAVPGRLRWLARAGGIPVILDIIRNHAGDAFGCNADRYLTWDENGDARMDRRWDGSHEEAADFRNAFGRCNVPFGPIDSANHGFNRKALRVVSPARAFATGR